MVVWLERVRASMQKCIGVSAFGAESAKSTPLLKFLRLLVVASIAVPTLGFGQAKMEMTGSFSVSPHGAASYTVPIEVPPGTAGVQPDLNLNYNSQIRSGMVGVGWSLGGLSVIYRCGANATTDGASAARGINYNLNDKFCLDGQRLVLAGGTYGAAGSEYRTEKESFTRVIAYGAAGNGPQYFVAYTKAGQVMTFGGTTDSRILPIINGVAATTPRTWAVSQINDRFNNWMSFAYSQDTVNGAYYPVDIYYTGNSTAGTNWYARVHFNYEGRTDTTNQYVGPAKINFTQRLSGIDTYTASS
jgi:Salmonella virulence plasmid 65kDa B protein